MVHSHYAAFGNTDTLSVFKLSTDSVDNSVVFSSIESVTSTTKSVY